MKIISLSIQLLMISLLTLSVGQASQEAPEGSSETLMMTSFQMEGAYLKTGRKFGIPTPKRKGHAFLGPLQISLEKDCQAEAHAFYQGREIEVGETFEYDLEKENEILIRFKNVSRCHQVSGQWTLKIF